MSREKWLDNFRELVRRKTNTLYFRSQNRTSSKKSGQLGGEKELNGFKSVIMYFQLSTQIEICTDKLNKILRYLNKFTHKKVGRGKRFAPFFLNDENYNLLHDGRALHRIVYVTGLVENYYKEYANSCEKYSDKLTELSPDDFRWRRRKTPKREDLCLVFQGKEGIDLSEDIKEHYERTRENWIWISWKGKKIISLEDEYNKWGY